MRTPDSSPRRELVAGQEGRCLRMTEVWCQSLKVMKRTLNSFMSRFRHLSRKVILSECWDMKAGT